MGMGYVWDALGNVLGAIVLSIVSGVTRGIICMGGSVWIM